jgi:transposase
MNRLKFVAALTDDQREELKEIYKSASAFRRRQRAQAVLLSAKGYTIDQLADIFDVDRDTLSGWLTQWERTGVDGLSDAPKSGRPRALSPRQRQRAIDLVKSTPRQITLVLARLKKTGLPD